MNGREMSSQTSAKLMKARVQRNQIAKRAGRRSSQKNKQKHRSLRNNDKNAKYSVDYLTYGVRRNNLVKK